jgi:IMP dehydrogenase
MCAASAAANTQEDFSRCQALVEAGVDVIALDTDDGVTDTTVEFIKRLKAHPDYGGNVQILAGLVSSVRQASELLEAGVDGLRIGSFATEGAADATSVYEIARIAKLNYGVPVCAEGVRDASQMFKALCVGASSVTMTDMLSQCSEAPGEHYYRDGVRVRLHPVDEVMGSNHRGAGLGVIGIPSVKKGLSGSMVARGSVRSLLPHFAKTVEKGLRDLSLQTITDVHAALFNGSLRMERQLTQPKPPAALEQHPRTARLATSSLHNQW